MVQVLEFADVDVVRGRKEILKSLSWDVAEGERWVVLGPNGAGKTTLLQLAATRMHPTRGTVSVFEEQLGKVDVFELRPLIGLSSAALTTHIREDERVLDVVLTAAYGMTGRWREEYEKLDERRAFRLLHEWGMSTMMNRTFGSLSEGERKRVQIARALMTDPELLLLDEPGAGLDLAGREDLVKRLTQLAKDPASPTLVLVTHHLEEIPPGFTHALMIREGEVVAAGPLGEVMNEENLSKTFDTKLRLMQTEGRFMAVAAE